MTENHGQHAHREVVERVRYRVRVLLRRVDRVRLGYFEATYTPIGQRAVRLLIAAAVLLVVLIFSIALVWFA